MKVQEGPGRAWSGLMVYRQVGTGWAAVQGEQGPPAAVVVPTHEHLTTPTADGAIGLVAVIVILVCTLQEAVLGTWEGVPGLRTPHPTQPGR